jgi:hypothetical protein
MFDALENDAAPLTSRDAYAYGTRKVWQQILDHGTRSSTIVYHTSPSRKRSAYRYSRVVVYLLASILAMITMMVVTAEPSAVVWTEATLEGELYELRFALEREGGVDDELSDVVKRSVNGQNVTWIWMLGDRDGEDVCG